MPKWWKSNKSKNIPMNISNDSTSSLNKKKSRSLVSFFFDKQKNSTRQIFDTNEHPSIDMDLSQQKQTYYRGQSIPYPTYHDAQIQFKHHSYEYLQLFDEFVSENNSCFGFSLSSITSKYCLYMTIIIFLGICLIISLTAILRK
jgi:hypothetical protein